MKYLFSLLLVCAFLMLKGQGGIEKKRTLSDKVFFGAGLGMQFGTITAIEVTPIVGYKPIEDLFLGVKGKYEFYKYRVDNKGSSIYGGSVFATYAIFSSFLAYAEYEALSLESAYFDPLKQFGSGDRFILQSPLIGVGYLQSLGGRSKAMLLLLWNLNETYGTYYSNPIIRVSFLF